MSNEFNKFKDAFIIEAKTYIKLMNQSLLALEKKPQQKKIFQNLMRALHTLKSLSATMNYTQNMNLCHTMEDLLATIHLDSRESSAELKNYSDILFECFDYFEENIKAIESDREEINSFNLMQKIQNILQCEDKEKNVIQPMGAPVTAHKPEKIQTIEVKVERLDTLMNLTEEFLVNKMKFDAIREQIDHPELTAAVEFFDRLISDLQYHVMQIRLVPMEFIFTRFLRMARDLAKQENKEVELKIEGGEIELDRMLIDEIGEVIVHLLRNAIDHGLETPEVRKKMNKPLAGTILLRATRSHDTATIEISDDGAGINLANIKKLALERNLVQENAPPDEIKQLIFANLSTKKQVTPISGRGLGLAIVKQKIESIAGHIKVETKPGQGTSFFIEIPLSLAIIKTLLVKVDREIYAIPLDFVERLLTVSEQDFKGLIDSEVIIFEDENIPIVRLDYLFGQKQNLQAKQAIVILRKDNLRVGLVVDSLLSTQEIVVKPIVRSFKNNKFFSGAALIGSGKAILILDVMDLLKTSYQELINERSSQ